MHEFFQPVSSVCCWQAAFKWVVCSALIAGIMSNNQQAEMTSSFRLVDDRPKLAPGFKLCGNDCSRLGIMIETSTKKEKDMCIFWRNNHIFELYDNKRKKIFTSRFIPAITEANGHSSYNTCIESWLSL